MGSGFSKMKKQARQMQEQMEKMQEEQKAASYEGSAGNGLVTVVLDGEKSLKSIEIKPDCVDPDDVDGLQDLIQAAFDEATAKVAEASSSMMPGFPGF